MRFLIGQEGGRIGGLTPIIGSEGVDGLGLTLISCSRYFKLTAGGLAPKAYTILNMAKLLGKSLRKYY